MSVMDNGTVSETPHAAVVQGSLSPDPFNKGLVSVLRSVQRSNQRSFVGRRRILSAQQEVL